jgi:hypothetical protein
MKPKVLSLFLLIFLIPGSMIFSGVARGQTQAAGSVIAPSGYTMLTANTPQEKVSVSFRTGKLDGTCAGASPLGWLLKAYGVKELTVVQDLQISIAGKSIGVIPGSVYAFLVDPREASLQFEKGSFVLRVDGGDASRSYFERAYFDQNGVNRLMSYGSNAPDQPSVDARFYRVTVKDR